MARMNDIRDRVQQLAKGAVLAADDELLGHLDELGLERRLEGGQVSLPARLELLDRAAILASVSSAVRPELEVLWQVGSTNTFLMERLQDDSEADSCHGLACLAEQQTAGRGRRGRTWVSPFGRNIYLSLCWLMRGGPSQLEGLSLVVGMVVVEALRSLGAQGVGLKWPNDLLLVEEGEVLANRKLGGILLEMGAPQPDAVGVVIGIGLNLALSDADAAQIDQPHAVLADVADVSRNALAGRLLTGLLDMLPAFSERGFGAFREAWPEFDVYRGQPVELLVGQRRVQGINAGVDQTGNLLLQTDRGVATYNAGEVSLRASSP